VDIIQIVEKYVKNVGSGKLFPQIYWSLKKSCLKKSIPTVVSSNLLKSTIYESCRN